MFFRLLGYVNFVYLSSVYLHISLTELEGTKLKIVFENFGLNGRDHSIMIICFMIEKKQLLIMIIYKS